MHFLISNITISIRVLSIYLLYAIAASDISAQPILTGMTNAGGDDFGVIYKTDINGNSQEVLHKFEGNSGAFPLFVTLCDGGGSKLYGTCNQGGKYNRGVIFSFDTASGIYKKIIDFDGSSLGSFPRGSLIRASNGLMYGLCTQGGTKNYGTIYCFNPAGNTCIKIHDFDTTASGGIIPSGKLLQANNGMLYGLTYQGGKLNEGVLYEFNLQNNTYTNLFEFDGSKNGRHPLGSLMQAKNGLLYGTCYQGGIYNFGLLFQFDPGNDSLEIKAHFSGPGNGSNPYNSLLETDSGTLLGMNFLGGSSNAGTVYRYSYINDSLYKIADLNGSGNGRNPYGGFSRGPSGRYYAMTFAGGTANAGVILEYNPANDSLTKKLDLGGSASARNPMGDFFLSKTGKLYGLSQRGGSTNSGMIFTYNPAGNTFTKLIEFNFASGGNSPLGRLCQASNRKLYGLTLNGGTSNRGVLFEYDAETDVFTKKHSFIGLDGAQPYSTLCSFNGLLLGTTYSGGSNSVGVIFKYDPVTSVYTKIYDFDRSNGCNPFGTLIPGPNGLLYGMCSSGGANEYGTIYSFNPSNSILSKLVDFDDSTYGGSPFGDLLAASDGKMYGMTYDGGAFGRGTLFSFDPSSQNITTLLHFNPNTTGGYAQGSLTENGNGNLYGMTQFGGNNGLGVLFRYRISDSAFTAIHHFDSISGSYPTSTLLKTSKGKMFGTARGGGRKNMGVIFEFDTLNMTVIKKHDFNDSNGNYAFGGLTEICLPSRVNKSFTSCDSMVSPSGKYIYRSSGTYSDTIPTVSGCDSIISLTVTIKQSSKSLINVQACRKYTAPDNQVYDSSGLYKAVLVNYKGCDSIVSIQLNILNTKSSIAVSACKTYTAPDGKIYDSSGIYTAVIPNSASCDSIISIKLNIQQTASEFDTSVCREYTAPDGKRYTGSGKITATIPNTAGCDSVISIDLSIKNADVSISNNDPELLANALNATFRWLYCDSSFKPVPNANNKSFTPVRNGNYAVEVTQNQCKDTSVCENINSLSLVFNGFTGGIKVYPNPGSGNFEVLFGDIQNELDFKIFDSEGRLLLSRKYSHTDSVQFDSFLLAGLYYLQIDSATQSAVIKLIIQ